MEKFLELLKNLGIEDEKAVAIKEEMKKQKLFFEREENLNLRYDKLKEQTESTSAELAAANKLIEELKAGTKGDEKLGAKVEAYETEIADLKSTLQATLLQNALESALRDAGGSDIDYLVYRLKEDGDIKLKEDGSVADLPAKLETLKAKYPAHFHSEDSKSKKIEPKGLKGDDEEKSPLTKDDFAKMPYSEMLNLKQTNPELYEKLSS